MLTLPFTGKLFELKGDPSRTITNKSYNADPASSSDKKVIHDFAKQMYFDLEARGNKSNPHRTLKKITEIA